MSAPIYERGRLKVRFHGGGLVIQHGEDVVIVDAPAGIVEALSVEERARVRAIVLSSGRMSALGGLLGLLGALDEVREPTSPLTLHGPFGDERADLLVEVWSRGWPDRAPVVLDHAQPGERLELGGLQARAVGLRGGEAQPRRGLISACGVSAWRFECAEGVVVWVPGAAPGAGVLHACKGAQLAVVEVGVLPWPRSERRWRMALSDVVMLAGEAEELWVVGDDGRFGPAGAAG